MAFKSAVMSDFICSRMPTISELPSVESPSWRNLPKSFAVMKGCVFCPWPISPATEMQRQSARNLLA